MERAAHDISLNAVLKLMSITNTTVKMESFLYILQLRQTKKDN